MLYLNHRFLVRRAQLVSFIDNKSATLYHQKMKAANLRWTQVWRRNHKKSQKESIAKKKSKKTTYVKRAVGGMKLEDLKKKQAEKPEIRAAAREAAVRCVQCDIVFLFAAALGLSNSCALDRQRGSQS